MSRQRPKKSDLDDLDNVLDDLLADDDPPKKPAARAGRSATKSKTPDDFYSSLAANAAESISDVSDADPNKMVQGLDDLDDMDAALFGPKKGAAPGNASGTTSTKKTPDTTKSATSTADKKSKPFDLDDYDDPLADLLSDGEDDLKPKKSTLKKPTPDKPPVQEETQTRARTKVSNKNSPRGKGRRLEVDRPPTRSGTKEMGGGDKPKRAEDNMFDDDDVLGGLGFDDSPRAKPGPKASKASEEDTDKGRSIMDDLLGGSNVTKHLERPGSGSDRSKEFVLDKRYKTPESKPKELTEEDFNFGGYMPSAVTTPGSRPGSRRSVRFEDEDEAERPTSQGGGRRSRGAASSFLEDMINKDDRDWLEMASGGVGNSNVKDKGDDRPKSEGSNREKALPEKPSTAQSEPVDWLGLSRLGSPDSSRQPRLGEEGKIDLDNTDPMPSDSRPRSGGRGNIPKETTDPDDWLGHGNSPVKQKSSPVKQRKSSTDKGDDWLGLGTSSPTRDQGTDWLGTKDSKEMGADDWLGVQKESSEVKSGRDDDWLGNSSGGGTRKEHSAASGDYLGLTADIDDPFSKSLSKSRADERGLDLFSPPPKREAPVTLPWETAKDTVDVSLSQGRQGRGRTPPQETKLKEKDELDHGEVKKKVAKKREREGPASLALSNAKPQSPRGSSPADSPHDLMATLDTLKKMDQQTRGEPPAPSAPLAAVVPVGTAATASVIAAHLPSMAPLQDPFASMGGAANLLQQQQQQMIAAHQLKMKQQEDLLKQQQQMMLEQQQKEQEVFEQQLAAKQTQLMQQQEEMAKQQMTQMQALLRPTVPMASPMVELQRQIGEQQQRLRQQQMAQMVEVQQRLMQQEQMAQIPQMSTSLGTAGMVPGLGMGAMFSNDLMAQVKRLELEKLHLETLMETSKSQHQEEMKLTQDSYNKRLEILEESYQKREMRLKEENELVTSQSMTKLRMVEQEKSDIVASHIKRLEELQQNHTSELDHIKEQQRREVTEIRKQHEESLERVRQAKGLEIAAIASQHDTTRNLNEVVQLMATNARNLDDLQIKVQSKHNLSMDERENAARTRDEQLKSLQDRLERQQHDNEMERSRLQGLLTKMESQLTEQTRFMEEEKWRVRQEEGRFQTAQSALEKEKTLVMDQLRREKEGVQRSKDQLLEEQKSVLAQLYEERRALASERAAFEMNQKLNGEQAQRENLKNVKTGAELESSVRIITDEKARLAKVAEELREEKNKLAKERSNLEQEQQAMQFEKEKLETIALQVRQRSQDIEEMCQVAAQAREAGETTLCEARRLETDQVQRQASIQAQLQTLRNKERQIAQERLSLAKEKQAVEQQVGSLLCVNCRTPVRDAANLALQPSSLPVNTQGTPGVQRKMSPAAAGLLSALDPDLRSKVESLGSISAEIEFDRTIRLWRIAADKDKQILNEETVFLQAIKHTPYADTSTQQGS